jgi:hypothetical protein
MTPDEAGLAVFHLFGRWFAFWREVPEPSLHCQEETSLKPS